MSEDISLSAHLCYDSIGKFWYFKTIDVKEFIRRLEEKLQFKLIKKYKMAAGMSVMKVCKEVIEEEAGPKLSEDGKLK